MKISLPCPRRNQRSFSICYPPVLRVFFYCFTNGTPCFLRVHFLTPFGGSPFLVLLGGRLTVLGHNLEKYESSKKLSAGQQHEKTKLFWSPTDNYQLWNRKLQNFQLHSPEILKISPNWKLNKTSNIFKFWTFSFRDRPNYSQPFDEYHENHSFVKRDQQEPSTATLV